MSNNTTNISNISDIINNTIEDPNYDFMNASNFFTGSDDSFRLVIIIYIFISFLLNSVILFTICSYKRRKEFSITGLLTWNILLINFFHTLFYMLNWLIKNELTETILDNGQSVNIGGLLLGNPNNFGICKIQAFFLITLSISQDIIINIFFVHISLKGKKANSHFFTLTLIIAGYIFPSGLSVIFYHLDILGISDKFCYFSKYSFNISQNKVEYFKYGKYKLFLAIIFLIRLLNFMLNFILFFRGIRYIKKGKSERKRAKIKSGLPVIAVTTFTLIIDLLYKFLSIIDSDLENYLVGVYLIINTADSILLPLAFSVEHHIYSYYMYLCCSINTKYFNNNNNSTDNETTIKDFDINKTTNDRKNKEEESIELSEIKK